MARVCSLDGHMRLVVAAAPTCSSAPSVLRGQGVRVRLEDVGPQETCRPPPLPPGPPFCAQPSSTWTPAAWECLASGCGRAAKLRFRPRLCCGPAGRKLLLPHPPLWASSWAPRLPRAGSRTSSSLPGLVLVSLQGQKEEKVALGSAAADGAAETGRNTITGTITEATETWRYGKRKDNENAGGGG